MAYQMILLPKDAYWSWVRASRDYVLAFGGNLSPDPEVALRSPFRDLVLTYPDGKGAFPELGNVRAWFSSRRPSLRLNAIEASTPEEFSTALRSRVDREDPFGESDRPISLAWPTDYPVITQPFGANPQIYGRFGLPGHEGVDFRALPHSNVYACSDGQVFQVNVNPRWHVYGIHIRIQHANGYQTTYAHLARPLVRIGEAVKAGQVIGKADSTGASNASHLHLLLKRTGSTGRGETSFPRDIVDPSPYLKWPTASGVKIGPAWGWPAGRCLVGAVGRIGESLRPADLDLASRARLEALAVESTERSDTLRRVEAAVPGIFILARVGLAMGEEGSPSWFAERARPDLARMYAQGVRYFELQPNPNLESSGAGRGWRDGRGFAGWFQEVVSALRSEAPEAKFGFPCLSPGGDLAGLRASASRFLDESEEAAAGADWIGVSKFWENAPDGALDVSETGPSAYRLRFPDQLLFVTEFGNASPDVPPLRKAEQYTAFYEDLRNSPGMGAAFCFALSSPRAHASIVWRSEDGLSTGIAELVGSRPG